MRSSRFLIPSSLSFFISFSQGLTYHCKKVHFAAKYLLILRKVRGLLATLESERRFGVETCKLGFPLRLAELLAIHGLTWGVGAGLVKMIICKIRQ